MTATLTPALLLPTGDPKPVEKSVVQSILDDFEPETFLWITFRRPDGGAHVWYAWTAGGHDLGDRIDQHALAAGRDASDWLAVTNRHQTDHHRGRIHTQAHPLRPIEADLRNGYCATEDERAKLRHLLDTAREMTGQPARPDVPAPRWIGVGPALLNRTG